MAASPRSLISPRSSSCPTLPSGAPSSPRSRGEGPIHKAAREGDIASIRLNSRFDIADGQGRFPIQIATIHGQTEIVAFLLQHTPGFLPLTEDKKSLFHLAASYGKVAVLELLPSTLLGLEDRKGRTALCDAVKSGQFESAVKLLEMGETANLSILDLALKKGDKAIAHLLLTSQPALFKEAIAHYKGGLGDTLSGFARDLIQLGDFTGAISAYESALLVYETTDDPDQCAEAWMGLGVAYLNSDAPERAIEGYNSALSIYEKCSHTTPNSNIARTLKLLAIAHGELSQFQFSLNYFERALFIYKQIEGSEEQIASTSNLMGVVYDHMGKPQEAIPYYQSAIELYTELYGADCQEVNDIKNSLSFCL